MSFLDIVLGVLLALSIFQGIRNGLFVELASLISLILGIYIAIKFSSFAKEILSGFVHWNPKTIQIVAFKHLLLILLEELSALFSSL